MSLNRVFLIVCFSSCVYGRYVALAGSLTGKTQFWELWNGINDLSSWLQRWWRDPVRQFATNPLDGAARSDSKPALNR